MGQGFAHERLPEKGTVLLLDTYDLTEILKECQSYASVGYKIASSQHENLKTTLSNAASRINETLIDFNSSPCYVSSATDLLSQQLIDIESAFNNLSFAFKEDLENLRENLSKFSVTLFGRTMAGKSTLMEILTNGDGLSIGNGAQRTTRDVRQYNWNGLEITDVPGIGAFEGEDDEQIAFEAAKKADLILFLITDDAPQAAEAECFGRIMDLGKPVICIMNVKASAPEGKSIKLLTRDIEKRFDMERLNEIRKQFMSYSKQLGQDWGYVPFVYVHLKSAFMSQNTEDPQVNLFAAILAKGISRQLKEGLYREYLNRKEDVAVVRGKIDMPGTIQNRLSRRRVLTCEYDELSENNLLNQILKTTVTLTTAIPAASYSIWKRCCIWMAVPAAHHGATPSQRISMSTVVTFTLSPRPKQLP